jgi:Flp pilus assembly protein TadG
LFESQGDTLASMVERGTVEMKKPRTDGCRGHAIVELSLMAPWIFFLFVGALDMGFYAYALISVQNAARVAAITTARSQGTAGNRQEACELVLREMERLPNVPDAADPNTRLTCDDLPASVQVDASTDFDADGKRFSRVRVQYETVQLVPIPGLLTGKTTITRTAESRVYGRTRP